MHKFLCFVYYVLRTLTIQYTFTINVYFMKINNKEGDRSLLSDFDGCLLPDELSDISQISRLIECMQQRHFSDELTRKITSENWFRVLGRIWK